MADHEILAVHLDVERVTAKGDVRNEKNVRYSGYSRMGGLFGDGGIEKVHIIRRSGEEVTYTRSSR